MVDEIAKKEEQQPPAKEEVKVGSITPEFVPEKTAVLPQKATEEPKKEGEETPPKEGEPQVPAGEPAPVKEGEEKGRKEEKRTLAKNLLEEEFPPEKIAELTGLSEKEIGNLSKEK